VIAPGNQLILIRCAEHHGLKIPQYTKYSGISNPLSETKSLVQSIKKEFSKDA